MPAKRYEDPTGELKLYVLDDGPPEPDNPILVMCPPDGSSVELTSEEARKLAAALVQAADDADERKRIESS